jgi:hypothetical protein
MWKAGVLFLAAGILSSTAASADPWKYRPNVEVRNASSYFACDSISAVDDFRALLKLNALDEMKADPHCFLSSEKITGVVINSVGEYIAIMGRMADGRIIKFWSIVGQFKSEPDLALDRCADEKKAAGLSETDCYDLADRENWID